MRRLSVLGCPSSAASYAAGQEQAPAALRAAGLIDALATVREVRDVGDLPVQVWQPDRDRPFAQNLDRVVANLQQLAVRLEPLLQRGDDVLVLGGNCTVVLGVLAALHRTRLGPPGLLYVDRGYDLNTPDSTTDGALDWMGLSHALDLPGALDELADTFEIRPLLQPDDVVWLGIDQAMTTSWEQQQATRLAVREFSSRALSVQPEASAGAALAALDNEVLAVHFDVDVLDFTDAPLAENTDGRNTGPTLNQAAAALRTLAGDPRFRVLSIGELNPTRSIGDPTALTRFCLALQQILAPPS